MLTYILQGFTASEMKQMKGNNELKEFFSFDLKLWTEKISELAEVPVTLVHKNLMEYCRTHDQVKLFAAII